MARLENRIPSEIDGEEFSIEDKVSFISEKLKFVKFVRFSEMFLQVKSKVELVVTFLAVLELIRLGNIKVEQSDVFGEIYIYGI